MASPDPVILKILNGVQSGVEVSLPDGDYALGSGSNDDIQLIDVSLLPGHARLRLAGTAMEIAGGEGGLRTSSGLVLESKGAFHAVEPLDIVTAGTTRFALGPRSANWASVNDDRNDTGGGVPRAEAAIPAPVARDRLKVLAVPLLALVLLLGLAGWFTFGTGLRSAFRGHDGAADVATLRAALDAFPFGQPVTVRQEVDGAVYVEGRVDTPVERRALAGAIDGTGVPARVRLWVLDSMRTDIKDLIAAQKVDVSFDLSPEGRLVLSGVILDKTRADAFVALLRDRVLGLAAVDSTIKTADTLLAEVRKLVVASQLQPWLLLRLDKDLIEVDGALPSGKVDAWVGFLQSYADKFAKQIALRSFVQLQGENGKLTPAPASAIVLGSTQRLGDSLLDLGRLQSGRYSLGDVFAAAAETVERPAPGARSAKRDGPALDNAASPRGAGDPASTAPGQGDSDRPTAAAGTADSLPLRIAATSPPGASDPRPPDGTNPKQGAAADLRPADSANPKQGAAADPRRGGVGDPKQAAAGPAGFAGSGEAGPAGPGPGAAAPGAVDRLAGDARSLLRRFRDGTLSSDPSVRDLYNSLVLLGEGEGGPAAPGLRSPPAPDWYLPLLSVAPGGPAAAQACWPGSQLDTASLLPTLFWLDLMSAGRTLSLTGFPRAQSFVLLEAALDPAGVRACARRTSEAARAADNSLYLREVRRNPGFVRFITRDLPSFSLDIAGASLGADRFILTQAGDKLFEGAAPDRGSRLALVGELGVVIQSGAGLSAVLFGANIDWLVSN